MDEALKFSTRISEIQTIAPKIDRNFQGLSKEVANLSKEFNFPLPDVAEAVYQTLSNQFTTAGQRADIMTAAAKLAKVGVMDLNSAVLLLTGTLNAYGMAVRPGRDGGRQVLQDHRVGPAAWCRVDPGDRPHRADCQRVGRQSR